MEILEVMKTRRSIRRYKATPVEDKTIELVLEAARWAPSWKNSQCWRFIVVRDSKLKEQLAQTLGIKVSGEPTSKPNPATDAVRNAQVIIVACAELGETGYYEGELATDKGEYWYMYDTALAMQNLVLAAHALGLGTVHVGLFDAKKVARILGVPSGFEVVAMTPLGYPEQQPPPRPRRELSQTVFYDKFGA